MRQTVGFRDRRNSIFGVAHLRLAQGVNYTSQPGHLRMHGRPLDATFSTSSFWFQPRIAEHHHAALCIHCQLACTLWAALSQASSGVSVAPWFLCSQELYLSSYHLLWYRRVLPTVFKVLDAVSVSFLPFRDKFFSGCPCGRVLCTYYTLNMTFGNGERASPGLGRILEGSPSEGLNSSPPWPCYGWHPSAAIFVQDSVGAYHGCSWHYTCNMLFSRPHSLSFPYSSWSSCCRRGWSGVTSPILSWQSPMHLWNELMVWFSFPGPVSSLWGHMLQCLALPPGSPYWPTLRLSPIVWCPD